MARKAFVVPAKEAKNHFGELLDAAQRAPVIVTKKGKPVAVLVRHSEKTRFTETEDKKLLAWVTELQRREALRAILDAGNRKGRARGIKSEKAVYRLIGR